MNIQWRGPAAVTNFAPGRSGNPISMLIDHWTTGSKESALAHFQQPGTVVSAHYIVGQDGSIWQAVFDEDTAFQAGDLAVNELSIGIEHEAGPTLPPSEALYAASAWLHAYLAEKYGLRLEVGVTVKRHRDIIPTACPGTLDVERIVNEAGGYMFTEADRQMLQRVKDILEAREPLVWQVRGQRNIDIERGGAVGSFDPTKPPVDSRVTQT